MLTDIEVVVIIRHIYDKMLKTEVKYIMEEFYTVKEIAEILKINKVTVQRWCKTNELPAVKIGKSYRIERNDFEEWYKDKRGEPYQEPLRF